MTYEAYISEFSFEEGEVIVTLDFNKASPRINTARMLFGHASLSVLSEPTDWTLIENKSVQSKHDTEFTWRDDRITKGNDFKLQTRVYYTPEMHANPTNHFFYWNFEEQPITVDNPGTNRDLMDVKLEVITEGLCEIILLASRLNSPNVHKQHAMLYYRKAKQMNWPETWQTLSNPTYYTVPSSGIVETKWKYDEITTGKVFKLQSVNTNTEGEDSVSTLFFDYTGDTYLLP
ncbi:hypothetical protein [Moorena sp. SIO3A2]|uniref:hypothetical protein n=1 Tax=Moorena sp. SIO3A2 TaxID=2607841 RepID=UPI0013B84134|nr:hypothetical protein [Moorena sp. SIO3A2]NER90401.1 hypothetical protein [Moorena sp. SIO3A2]